MRLRLLGLASLLAFAVFAVPASAATERLAWSSAVGTPQQSGLSLPQTTYRLIAKVTAGGDVVRIRLSNAQGTQPLVIGSTAAGVRVNGAAVAGHVGVLFGGQSGVSIAPGGEQTSDPIALHVARGDELAVSMYVRDASTTTLHDNDFEGNEKGPTQYLTQAGVGNKVADDAGTSFTQTQRSVPWLDAITVETDTPVSVVCLGDSITDGPPSSLAVGVRRGAYDRYPDVLAQRLADAGIDAAVSNQGISGDTAGGGNSRLERDVLGLPGVTHAIVELGSNDLGAHEPDYIISALTATAQRLRARGIVPLVATMVPRNIVSNDRRLAVNQWIRTQTVFDGVIDFDAAVRNAADDGIDASYDSGDGMHLTPAGYAKLASVIDLHWFVPAAAATPLSVVLSLPKSIGRSTLRKRGVPVRVALNESGTVTASLVRRGARVKAHSFTKRLVSVVRGSVRLRPGSVRSGDRFDVVVQAAAPGGATAVVRRHLSIRG